MNDVLEKADQAVKRREAIALCTVVDTVASVPMKPGAKLLVWQDGRSYGTIGGGNVEKQVIDDAIQLIGEYKSETKEYNLLALKMCCGGSMKIFIDSLPVNRQLLVFGAGHIGKHIIDFANKLHFQPMVIDERDEFINSYNCRRASKLSLSHEAALPLWCLMTHPHRNLYTSARI
ncbi:MAG: XdhC family protein [Bacteroidetes bacterium]|nr:XdhC family protein [Bacteroidota bacterium]